MITRAVPIVVGAIEAAKSDPIPWVQRTIHRMLSIGGVAMGILAVRGYYLHTHPGQGPYELIPPQGVAGGSSQPGASAGNGTSGFDASDKGKSAQWMASAARTSGIPPEIPVMAYLNNAPTGVKGNRGIFGVANSGKLKPQAQLHQFLQMAAADSHKTSDPNQYGAWVASLILGAPSFGQIYQRWYQTARNLVQMAPKPVDTPHGGGAGIQVRATAYNGAEPGGGGFTTASGTPVRWGVVAVDPTVIPLGTRMNISGFGNQVFVAEDTGGAIKGHRIDIWYPTVAAARRFGVQQKVVYLLGK